MIDNVMLQIKQPSPAFVITKGLQASSTTFACAFFVTFASTGVRLNLNGYSFTEHGTPPF